MTYSYILKLADFFSEKQKKYINIFTSPLIAALQFIKITVKPLI